MVGTDFAKIHPLEQKCRSLLPLCRKNRLTSIIQGVINSTPCSEIRWIPGSDNLFLAAHMDGALVVYDKEKEDAPFIPEDEAIEVNNGESGEGHNGQSNGFSIRIKKSVNSKNQKNNPVAAWKLSNHRPNALAFSPDSRHLAVVSEDGVLRIIDYLREE